MISKEYVTRVSISDRDVMKEILYLFNLCRKKNWRIDFPNRLLENAFLFKKKNTNFDFLLSYCYFVILNDRIYVY